MTRLARAVTLPVDSREDEVAALRRQLRRAVDKNARAFDQGFQAAVRMVETGATLERLKEASGVVHEAYGDTGPTELTDQEDTEPVCVPFE